MRLFELDPNCTGALWMVLNSKYTNSFKLPLSRNDVNTVFKNDREGEHLIESGHIKNSNIFAGTFWMLEITSYSFDQLI